MAKQNMAAGIAVVTGAAGGIGQATAKALFDAGWKELLLSDLDAGRLEKVAAPLRTAGAVVRLLAGDVADLDFPANLVAALCGRSIGAIVHSAGTSPRLASAERILEVNLAATTRLVDAVRGHMAPGSAAVLIASSSAYFPIAPDALAAVSRPLPHEGIAALLRYAPTSQQAYPLSKAGVVALVKRQGRAFGERHARIVSISPGATDTGMLRGENGVGEGVQAMVDSAAIPRLAQPDEIAAVAAFICSPLASFVTATDILVDGGEIAGMGFASGRSDYLSVFKHSAAEGKDSEVRPN